MNILTINDYILQKIQFEHSPPKKVKEKESNTPSPLPRKICFLGSA